MRIGFPEVMALFVIAVLVCAVIALFLPRKWVPLKVKRIIASVWMAVGLLQIARGASYAGKDATLLAMHGMSDIAIFGGLLLMFMDKRWSRVTGGCAIFLGFALLTAAGALTLAR